jgi:hypothetical protein
MKARNGILALLAILALAGCSVDTAPTEPGTAPRNNEGGPTTLGSGNKTNGSTATTSDSTLARNIITIGSGN